MRKPVFKCILYLTIFIGAAATLFPKQANFMNLQKLAFYYSRHTNEYFLAATSIDNSTRCGPFDTNNVHVILKLKNEKEIIIRNEKLKVVCLGTMYNQMTAGNLTLFRFNLVIDNSGSIDPTSLRFVQDALTKFIQNMPVVYQAQVIRFSGSIQAKSPFLKDKNALVEYVNRPLPQGRTILYDAVTLGVDELVDPGHRIPLQFSVVLTDGKDTGSRMSRSDFKTNIVRTCRENFIPLFIVGVTDEVDSQLLREVTKFGMFQHIKRFPDIDKAFNLILEQIKDTYIIKIPARGEFSNLETIFLVKERRPGKYDTVQDFIIQ